MGALGCASLARATSFVSGGGGEEEEEWREDARGYTRGSVRSGVYSDGKVYWVCKRAPAVAVEATEVRGGNGYVVTF